MKTVILDIEANSLTRPSKIWLIVCKDVASGELRIFRQPTEPGHEEDALSFSRYAKEEASTFIGHNIIDYDNEVLKSLLSIDLLDSGRRCIDTLIISKLLNYSRPGGHSLEQYGLEFGLPKIDFKDWTHYSQEMEDYCVRDVEINHRVYRHLLGYLDDRRWADSVDLEHRFQTVVTALNRNGFAFNRPRAETLLTTVQKELSTLDEEISNAFPQRLQLVKEVHPRITQYGTLNKSDFRWHKSGDLSEFNGGPFCRCAFVSFNPNSHKQIIDVLHNAGWSPTDKTKTHIDSGRSREAIPPARLEHFKKYGWKVNEENLSTLPPNAPKPARLLAKRILLESRRRTLTEWLGLVQEDGRIRGRFYGLGAWTHRMAHQMPNTANIPTEHKLYGKEMRALWCAPP